MASTLPLAASPVADAARSSSAGEVRAVRVVDAASGGKTGKHPKPHAKRFVVGGTVVGIQSAPWQVFVWSIAGDCGGSILNATTVLTAAHCVDGATGVGKPPSQGGIQIWAGLSNIEPKSAPGDNFQIRDVAVRRIHPFWKAGSTTTTGDIAVLTFTTPLALDGVATQAVTLPPLSTPPAADSFVGQPLKLTGYGVSVPFGTTVDNLLRTATVTQTDPDYCGDDNNAVTLCGRNPTGSSCQGDSGGPLVIAPASPGAAPVQVGLVSNGPIGCAADTPDFYTNLRAPEVRAFVDSPATPPLAPRRAAGDPVLTAPPSMREGDTITCTPAAFTGAVSVETRLTNDQGVVLASTVGGPTSAVLTASQVGRTVRCRSYATSPGGVAVSYLVGFTTPVTAKPVAPVRQPKAEGACTRYYGSGLSSLIRFGPSKVTLRRGQSIKVDFEVSNLDSAAKSVFLYAASLREGKKSKRFESRTVDVDANAVPGGKYQMRLTIRLPQWAKVGKTYHLKFYGSSWDSAANQSLNLPGENRRAICDLLPDRTLKIKIKR